MAEAEDLRAKLEEMRKSSHRGENEERKQVRDDVSMISRFPEENPNPVMGILANGELLYANPAATEMLEEMGWREGASLPEELSRSIRSISERKTEKGFELLCPRNRVFSFMVSPNDREGYTHLYAHDITERKRAEEALRESEERFRALYEKAPLGIARIDSTTGRFLLINARYCDILQRTEAEVLQLDLQTITHPDDLAPDLENMKRLRDGLCRLFEMDKRYLRPDGSIVWVNLTVVPEWAEGQPPSTHIAMVTDITARKQAEEALRESEMFLKETQSIARVGGWKANPETDFLEWTEGVYRIVEAPLDYKPGVAEGLKFYLPKYIPLLREKLRHSLETGDPFQLECEVVTTTEKRLWTEVRGFAHRLEGNAKYVIGTFQDITERKRVEEEIRRSRDELELRVQERTEELAKSQQRLQVLASQLLLAQEKERKRVALELHDGLMSELAATKFLLEGKIMILDSGKAIHPGELRRIADVLANSMKEVRRIMNNLHPSTLDELGLIATISWLCGEYQKSYPHITVQQEIGVSEKDIAEGTRVVIYRVLQEALNNFARHGKGDCVEVSLLKSAGTFSFVIRDNGQGFDVENAEKGLGLESMKERVELSGGEFQVESMIGQGTTIRAIWSRS